MYIGLLTNTGVVCFLQIDQSEANQKIINVYSKNCRIQELLCFREKNELKLYYTFYVIYVIYIFISV